MPRECPGCGAAATLEARFCRRCGATLKVNSGHDTASPISPKAQTVPLTDEGRTTDGLWTEESQQLASGTSRIRRTEMEDMLRRVSREHGGDGPSRQQSAHAGGSGIENPPLTSTPQTPRDAAPSDKTSPATTATTTIAARSPRRWHSWHWAILTLLCVTLAASLLGFIAYRKSRVTSAVGDTPVLPVSEEKQTDASTAEGVPPPEQATAAAAPSSPTISAGPEPSPARGTEAAARPSSEVVAASRTTPVLPSETRQTKPSSPPALSASDHYQRGVQLWEGDRRAALESFRAAAAGGVADAYFYLGSEYYPAGRDPRALSEGELRAALNYFLRATSGPHSAQASRSAQALGKEYERRKKQSRP